MDVGLRMRSVTRKWMLNIMPVIIAIVVFGEVFVGINLFDDYKTAVRHKAEEYIRNINILSMTDESGFESTARKYARNFEYRDKIEVQIYDNAENMIVTTNGFASVTNTSKATDYSDAVKSGEAEWYGINDNGERVLASTTILPDLGYGSNGAYRVLVSMDKVIKNYYIVLAVMIAVGLFIIGVCFVAGMFFINSIVRPVRDVTATARKIAGGDMKSRITVNRNDEIGELCDTINYMASELEHADTVKNDFISSVSHELRTPLTAIKGWGETVQMSIGEDDEIVRHGVEVMLGETSRLSGLVEELLDFSRIESGSLSITPSKNDPVEIVGSVVDTYEEIARQQKKSFVFVKPAKTDMIMADRDRIKQVFINIIDNAIKYTETGGHIVVSMFNEEGCIRVTISDTGCGIPAKDLDHVKEKFYKANTKVRGSGIGLAVADEIIKHHNGLLFVESTEEVGTTVTVVLPTVKNQPDEITEVIFPPDQKG